MVLKHVPAAARQSIRADRNGQASG